MNNVYAATERTLPEVIDLINAHNEKITFVVTREYTFFIFTHAERVFGGI
jgi:hypothetical protein